ncbi:CD209 antigen-like [Epinephelus moara]|uniref:CD209 antigen-like n=1 Tax=Epinephelus moara TaxID=300413 RepID=UPI00214F1151|nr:CD209 antigen-like [Epinephelus moara]
MDLMDTDDTCVDKKLTLDDTCVDKKLTLCVDKKLTLDDTCVDKKLTLDSVLTEGETPALTDTDTPVQPAGRKRISPFDTVDCQKKKLTSRYVTVCLGVLCAVLLAGNIGQLVYYASHRSSAERLQSSYDALTADRKQLEARLSDLTREKDQLQRDKEQLQTNDKTLWQEKQQLQTSYIKLASGCLNMTTHFQNKMLRTAVQVRSLPCQTGWTKFGDNCYIVSTEKKNWTASRDACSAVGADLVTIKSSEEQAFVNGIMPSGLNAWIGMTDSRKEGTWMWVDGTLVNTTHWRKDQPNSHGGEQDCGEIVQKSPGVGGWNDDGCFGDQSYICEQ